MNEPRAFLLWHWCPEQRPCIHRVFHIELPVNGQRYDPMAAQGHADGRCHRTTITSTFCHISPQEIMPTQRAVGVPSCHGVVSVRSTWGAAGGGGGGRGRRERTCGAQGTLRSTTRCTRVCRATSRTSVRHFYRHPCDSCDSLISALSRRTRPSNDGGLTSMKCLAHLKVGRSGHRPRLGRRVR